MTIDPRRAKLLDSLVNDAFDFTVTIRDDFTIGFASEGLSRALGRPAAEYLGEQVADHVHPDDLDRALLHLNGWSGADAPGGVTMFRFRCADGSWRPFDVTAATVTDGVDSFLAVYCRPVDYQAATDEILFQLLNGGTREQALRPVLDVFSWDVNGSHVAIAWHEPGEGQRHVSTGLPIELTGADPSPGRWWHHARTHGQPVLQLDHDDLDPYRAALAFEHGAGGCWVVPVPDAAGDHPALITVWTRPEIGRPDGHAYGMTIAEAYVELILRWASQVEALTEAARRDPLTEIPNRTALFERLEQPLGGGALLYCDLDRFKPINDTHGHQAGDRVLCEVAKRIQAACRPRDLVARIGGDEFVVAAPGASPSDATAMATAILDAVSQPIEVEDGLVTIGVTVGIAHDPDDLGEHLLSAADHALITAKAHERGTVRWA